MTALIPARARSRVTNRTGRTLAVVLIAAIGAVLPGCAVAAANSHHSSTDASTSTDKRPVKHLRATAKRQATKHKPAKHRVTKHKRRKHKPKHHKVRPTQHRRTKPKHHKVRPTQHRRTKPKVTTTPASGAPKVTAPNATNPAPAGTGNGSSAPIFRGPPESSQWFSPTSVWRAPLGPVTPVSADSSTLVNSLVNYVYNGDGIPWINSSQFSTPIYTVPADQPDVSVTLTEPNLALQQALDSVPLPANAQPAAGTDHELVVWQPSTGTMWEFWKLQESSTGSWTAGWGGTISDLSQSPGYYTGADSQWGATATSLPLLGGLITIDDLERGRINHALALAIPNVAHEQYVWPAQRDDGWDLAADAIPEGTRFRIPADVDLTSMNLPPVTLELAEAAQRYGIVVRDQSNNVVFFAEDPTPTGTNPYAGFWQGTIPNHLMGAFPWSLLQVVDDGPVTPGW